MIYNHFQQNSIYSLPDVLIINLNRGKANQFDVDITYPETIDLNNYEETKIYNNIYNLRCIVAHKGPHGTAGHYVAFCYVENKQKWYLFNDCLVQESSFKDASAFGRSYVLFYKRQENNQ